MVSCRDVYVMLDVVPNHMGGPTTLTSPYSDFHPFNESDHYHHVCHLPDLCNQDNSDYFCTISSDSYSIESNDSHTETLCQVCSLQRSFKREDSVCMMWLWDSNAGCIDAFMVHKKCDAKSPACLRHLIGTWWLEFEVLDRDWTPSFFKCGISLTCCC